jgi:heat shock protein HspQ
VKQTYVKDKNLFDDRREDEKKSASHPEMEELARQGRDVLG